ncbi:MAG: DUF4276 family protein [Bacteroidales bacterium]|nr:DUF4276 family protein [Bacteroidales bacterium]
MVNLNIIVEGGTFDPNSSEETFNNVEALRESLNKFFSRLLMRDDISVRVDMGAGYRNSAKRFVKSADNNYLYVDSDDADTSKWFDRLNNSDPSKAIIIPEDAKDKVFFMIQEMEAWFLKQPECLERWGKAQSYIRTKKETAIASDNQIAGKDIETLSEPSKIVGVIVQRYFERLLSNGKKKKVKYGKLKSAPAIIDNLDEQALVAVDKELYRFKVLF